MASRFRVLAVVLIAAVVALLWVPAAGAASDVAGQPPALHLYDGHDRESVRTAATTGPPVAFDHTATPEAVDRQSCGSSASPSARTSPAIYNYGDTALPARTARGSHGVEGSNRGGTAACAVVQRLSVAAKGGDEAFHYTSSKWIESITTNGLNKGAYATPDGSLSPLQASLQLALPPNRALPDAALRIDLAGLRKAGYDIPTPTRVSSTVSSGSRTYSMPGGGYEMQFPYAIPPEFIKVVPR